MIRKRSISSLTIGITIALNSAYQLVAQGQIEPDDSLGDESSIIVPDNIKGRPSERIEGGATRGDNLFHSFQNFNVGSDRGAYFNNPTRINNIFTRVTGTNVSQINGTLGVLGNANLFLINPNGILFGANARLDLRGSFSASSAESLIFDGFVFSTSNPQIPPLLQVNIPVGFSFRDNPGAINSQLNSSDTNSNSIELQVDEEQSLTLIGGDINLTRVNLTASEGRVELGAVDRAGSVDFNELEGIKFADDIEKGKITISNSSRITVNPFIDGNGGEINIIARNITLDSGSILDASNLITQGNAGNISLQADNNILINGSSGILNNIGEVAKGNVGEINLEADSIFLTNGSQLQTRFFANSEGNKSIGKISLFADNSIKIDNSAIFTNNEIGAIADSSDIKIVAKTLSVSKNANLLADNLGQGNAGNINIQIEEELSFTDNVILSSNIGSSGNGNIGNIELTADSISLSDSQLQAGFFTGGRGNEADGKVSLEAENSITFDSSSIFTNNEPGAIADTVEIEITSGSITFDNSTLATSNLGDGKAGNVVIKTLEGGISLTDSSIFTNSTTGQSGDINLSGKSLLLTDNSSLGGFATEDASAGNVIIETIDFVILDKESSISVFADGNGTGGHVKIDSSQLNILRGSDINVVTLGNLAAGQIAIDTSESVTIDDTSQLLLQTVGSGDAGSLELNTESLDITEGSLISSATFTDGKGGNLKINANKIKITGTTANGLTASRIDASTSSIGSGGDIEINANDLTIKDGSAISAFAIGSNGGKGGNIKIKVENSINISGFRPPIFPSSIDGESNSINGAGDINITTANLRISDGAKITTSTAGEGVGGNVNISATDSLYVSGFIPNTIVNSQIASQSTTRLNQPVGGAGNINISTPDLLLQNRGEITVGGLVGGLGTASAGNLEIDADIIRLDNSGILNAQTFGIEGNINLISKDIFLGGASKITTNAFSTSAGGNIIIDTENLIAFPNENSDISANAENSLGGRVFIDAKGIFGTEFRETATLQSDITATSELGAEFIGEVTLNTPDFDPTTGLINLPASVSDASDQISQNPCEQGVGSEFIVTGKGGLPPSPSQVLNRNGVEVDLIEPLSGEIVQTSTPNLENQISKNLPAMGWVFNDQGKVILTADSNTDTETEPALRHRAFCNTNNSP